MPGEDLENVGIAVRDLEATIAFFTDLGLTVLGRDTVSGEWTDTAVGLDGNHAKIAMLQRRTATGAPAAWRGDEYEDVYRLTYVRGPSGIIVMLAQELKKG